jgi:hypothetical protein
MQTYLLQENVLTDNVLLVADKGKVFKNGIKAIVKENTFLNAWQDKETVKNFRTEKSLMKYLRKQYDEKVVFEIDLSNTCFDC